MNEWVRVFLICILVASFASFIGVFVWMFANSSGLSLEVLRLRREAWITALHFVAIFSFGAVSAVALEYYLVGDEKWI